MIRDALRYRGTSSVLYARSYTGTEAPRAASSTSLASKARKCRSSNRSPSRATLARCMASKPPQGVPLGHLSGPVDDNVGDRNADEAAPLPIEGLDRSLMLLTVEFVLPLLARERGPGFGVGHHGGSHPLGFFDRPTDQLSSLLFFPT